MEKVQETGIMKKLMMLALAVVLVMPALIAPSASAVGSLGQEWQDGREDNNDYTDGNDEGEDYGAIPGLAGGFDYDVFGSSDPLGLLHDAPDYNNLPGTYGQDGGVSAENNLTDAQELMLLDQLRQKKSELRMKRAQHDLMFEQCMAMSEVEFEKKDCWNKIGRLAAEVKKLEQEVYELEKQLGLA